MKKKFSSEEKAAMAVAIGLFGTLLAQFIAEFWIKNSLLWELVIGAFAVTLIVGSIITCRNVCRQLDQKLPKLAVIGDFGFVICITAECIVDWVARHLFGIELPTITQWYAIPLLLMFLIGLFGLFFQPKR